MRKIVVASQRRVGLELVMTSQARLTSGEGRVERGASRGIAANRQLFRDDIAVGSGESQDSQENGEIISDVVKVLLSIHQFVERHNAVAS